MWWNGSDMGFNAYGQEVSRYETADNAKDDDIFEIDNLLKSKLGILYVVKTKDTD